MKKSLFTVLTFVKINTRRFFRDRLAIFFSIAFPLIFLFVFGGLFGSNSGGSFHVALINDSKTPFASQFVSNLQKNKSFNIDGDAKTIDAAKEKMTRGQLDATIQLPANFGELDAKTHFPSGEAKVLYTQNNAQAGQTLTGVLQGVFKGINEQFVKVSTPFKVASEQLTNKSLSSFDYTFAGLLGFAIIGMGIFGPVNVFPELKKQGILRRLHTTPLKVWQYFLSTMIGQAIIGLLTMTIMFTVAVLVFHLKISGNILELALFLVMGIVTILGIGLALGGWAKNERQVAPLANIVVFPMMFLSGTFFPRYLMPDWLQNISGFLPLTPIIDGIRLIATEGKHLIDIGPQVGLVVLWAIIIYFIAFRVFRWE